LEQLLTVNTPSRTYPIYCQRGSLRRLGTLVDEHMGGQRVFVVSQQGIWKHYGDAVMKTLGKRACGHLVLPDGEAEKTLANVEKILTHMVNSTPLPAGVLALGGGVTGDMAGFAAGVFRRGIPYLQVPTTLLSQVDSSVGGKTGVDFQNYKNYVGVFHQPHLVVIDPNVLKTLPPREISAGLAEVVKYGLLFSKPFYNELQSYGDKLLNPAFKNYDEIILKSCAFKAKVVKADERDSKGRRALLNLGHTFGHAIETTQGLGELLHGEAVAIGLVAAARLSFQLGMTKTDLSPGIASLLTSLNLPVSVSGVEWKDLYEALKYDKKFTQKHNAFVLMKGIGQGVLIKDVPIPPIKAVLKSLVKEQSP
jgi:3-dehydroquinate synthase